MLYSTINKDIYLFAWCAIIENNSVSNIMLEIQRVTTVPCGTTGSDLSIVLCYVTVAGN